MAPMTAPPTEREGTRALIGNPTTIAPITTSKSYSFSADIATTASIIAIKTATPRPAKKARAYFGSC